MLIGVPREPSSRRTTRAFYMLHKYEVITVAPLRERQDPGFREQVIGCLGRKGEGNGAGRQKVVGNKIGTCLLQPGYSQGQGLQKPGEPSFWYKGICWELDKPQADLMPSHPAPCIRLLKVLKASKRIGLANLSSPWNALPAFGTW